MSKSWRVSVIAGVALLMLAGCTPTTTGGPSASPSASEAPSATASPSPSPTPTRSAKATLGELIATPNGIADSFGPMLVTVTQPIVIADPALAVVEWTDDVCDWGEPTADSGGFKPAYPLTSDGKYPFFANMAGRSIDSPVQWISVQATEIRSAEGRGIGSTVADLQAEYGSDLVVTPSFDYTGYSLHGSLGQLTFWAQADGIVSTMDIQSGLAAPVFHFHTTPCA